MVALKQGSVPDVIANKLDHLLILTSGTEQYLITCTNKKYKFLLTTTLTISAKELFALQERHTMAFICVTISGCKGLWSDSDFKTDYCAQVDRQEINCMPVEIHDITDDDMVEQAINTCAMIMNYSVGRKSR